MPVLSALLSPRRRLLMGVIVAAAGAGALMLVWSRAQAQDAPCDEGPDRPCAGCGAMTSALCQLVAAPDPVALAAERGLQLEGERVRVVLELADAEGDLAAVHDLVVEARYAGYVQALVRLEILCVLAHDPRVRRVEPPTPAIPGEAGQMGG